MLHNALSDSLGDDVAIDCFRGRGRLRTIHEAVGAHLDLLLALLAADIEDATVGNRKGCLKKQRRLADTRLSAKQQQRAWHYAASKYPVELATSGRDALGLAGRDILNQFGLGSLLPKGTWAVRRCR